MLHCHCCISDSRRARPAHSTARTVHATDWVDGRNKSLRCVACCCHACIIHSEYGELKLWITKLQVDLDRPDCGAFPEFATLPFVECVLEPGQMLYVPPQWWHYVKALTISFSVSFWWQ